jgi:iron complex transport system substrate-binding protein
MWRALLLLALCGTAHAERIVSVGGAVTEIVFALDSGKDLVGVDTSSIHPAAQVAALPKVGYQRQLAAEGIVSLKPTLVLAAAEAGPPAVLEQLRAAKLPVRIIPSDNSVDGAVAKIRTVAAAIGKVKEGERLAEKVAQDLKRAVASVPPGTRPRAVFVLARGAGNLFVAGQKNAGDAILKLAGADNALTSFEGFRPLTAEALVAAAPDVIVVPEGGAGSIGGIDGVLAMPGVALTPAGKHKRVVTMNDLLLLGFGPRTGEAIETLSKLMRNKP